MKVLHLSDTTLSGSPYRISALLNNNSDIESRHIVYQAKIYSRVFQTDLVGEEMNREELQKMVDWADIIHYHNRWKRQQIFRFIEVPKKPSVIQIHSPRGSENFSEELASGIPLAVIAQYHVREWPELKFIIPNVVDINEQFYTPMEDKPPRTIPMVAYSPSNANGKGWDDKSYSTVAPFMKRMNLANRLHYKLIFKVPHVEALVKKRDADIGIEEVATGSYHLSGLEFLSMGIPCICRIDEKTADAIKTVTGSDEIPFIQATPATFGSVMMKIVQDKSWGALGSKARDWMEKNWSPDKLVAHYKQMYERL